MTALAVPVGFFLIYPNIKASGAPLDAVVPIATFEPSAIKFERVPLTPPPEFGQMYTHVQLEKSNSSGWNSVLAADGLRGRVVRLERQSDGSWNETVLNKDRLLPCPAHITPTDLDQDGDVDYLVSCIGGVQPTSELCGRVVWLENKEGEFTTRDLLTQVRRVTDAQVGDFDGDGDTDMVVAVFGGYLQGQVLYLENDGKQNFTDYEVMNASGTIHVPVRDFDGDGDLDFAAVVSQEEEEVWAFENEGNGFRNPKRHLLFSSSNFDLGSAGMVAADIDQDGDEDLLLALGDNLELINNAPQPWHGVKWLENKGGWKFEASQIAVIGGVYGVSPGDLDGDGDTDLAVVTMFTDWAQDGAASVVWLENDGKQNFSTRQIASEPIQLATVDCGDIDNDGSVDIITGSFHFRKPFAKFGSVDAFFNPGTGPSSSTGDKQ